jgi:hypothetical protein
MWNLRFSGRRVWRWLSSELFRRVVWSHHPDDGGSKHLWNIGKRLPDYKAQQPRRQPSSYNKNCRKYYSLVWIGWTYALLLLEFYMSLHIQDVPRRCIHIIIRNINLVYTFFGTPCIFKTPHWYQIQNADLSKISKDYLKHFRCGAGLQMKKENKNSSN